MDSFSWMSFLNLSLFACPYMTVILHFYLVVCEFCNIIEKTTCATMPGSSILTSCCHDCQGGGCSYPWLVTTGHPPSNKKSVIFLTAHSVNLKYRGKIFLMLSFKNRIKNSFVSITKWEPEKNLNKQ